MGFPIQRLRRLRQHDSLRRMVRETTLSPSDFIYPLFVVEGQGRREEIASMPGQFRLSIDLLVKEAGEIQALGIPAIILFGIPAHKDERGSSAWGIHGAFKSGCEDSGEYHAGEGVLCCLLFALPWRKL